MGDLEGLREVNAGDLARRCAICQTAFQPAERLGGCPTCASPFHEECWTENGGCAAYGCAEAPAVVAAAPVPSSVWGQEDKSCPGCGARIKLAAVRCRHCGRALPAAEVGSSSSPSRAPALFLLAAGVLPPTAPLAALAGGAWLLSQRRQVKRWPAATRTAAVAGLIAALAVSAVMAAGLLIHLVRRQA